jgi:hypothetical protein
MIVTIMEVAEQTRVEGMANYGRAALKKIADGKLTFYDAFVTDQNHTPTFVPAHRAKESTDKRTAAKRVRISRIIDTTPCDKMSSLEPWMSPEKLGGA